MKTSLAEQLRRDVERVIYDLQIAEIRAKDYADEMRGKSKTVSRDRWINSSLAGSIGVAVDDLQFALRRLDREDV